MLFPERLAFCPVHAPEKEVVSISDVQKDALAPDDGRRAGPARHGEFPGDVVFGAPTSREILLAAYAIEKRPTPLRPVVGETGATGQRN